MSIRRRTSKQEETASARRSRRPRRTVGANTRVRVVSAEPRPKQKRARFDIAIAAPSIQINPWRTKREWKASRPKFAAGVLVVLLLAALYAMFNLDMFYVTEPQVIGNRIVTHDEIVNAAGVRGWNIFFVEPNAVQAAVSTLPEFKSVQVYTSLPNTVEIYTTERKPIFVWEVAGKNYWVDDEGIAMRPRGMVPTGFHVRDSQGTAVKYGERVNPDAFNAAVSLINAWKGSPKYFEWTPAHGLTLRDEHGWMVYFGSASQMDDKLTAFNIVTNQLTRDKRQVAFIDLGSGLPYYQEIPSKVVTSTNTSK